jgi:hypothetical protein
LKRKHHSKALRRSEKMHKYLSKKDSSTMLPELTEFVPATRMGIVRKVLLGLENRAGCIFSLLLNAFE